MFFDGILYTNPHYEHRVWRLRWKTEAGRYAAEIFRYDYTTGLYFFSEVGRTFTSEEEVVKCHKYGKAHEYTPLEVRINLVVNSEAVAGINQIFTPIEEIAYKALLKEKRESNHKYADIFAVS